MKHFFLFILTIPFMIACATSSHKMEHSINKELMDLEYLVRQQKDTTQEAPVLILLHGYGSNEKDLFALADRIPDNWLVVSVRAPIALGRNQFKWYDVKMVNQKITMNFEDEEKSRQQLLKLVDQIISKYHVDKNKIVIAGFSQGANMSVGLFLTAPKKIHAAGCFSGRFMEEIKPLIKDKSTLKSGQVFIAHGTQDQMLPLRYAEENKTILEGFGINVKLSTDAIAHSISPKQLNEFIEWMKAL
ncbi:MAG: alpha/beta hydrolase [Saprospiraceae bacterium]